jgi:hypothetical protein
VRAAVAARKTLVEFRPGSDAAVYVERIARKLAEAAEEAR